MSTPASLKKPFSSATAHGIPFAAAPKFAAPISSAATSRTDIAQTNNANSDTAAIELCDLDLMGFLSLGGCVDYPGCVRLAR
jgi:hypothetical protein